MDEILKDVLSQNGVIAFLFVSTFVAFVYKGIPYLLSKFDDVTIIFSNTIKDLQDSHREDMKTISDVFIAQIKESNLNHEITHSKLEEIKVLVSKKK